MFYGVYVHISKPSHLGSFATMSEGVMKKEGGGGLGEGGRGGGERRGLPALEAMFPHFPTYGVPLLLDGFIHF